MDAVRDEVQDMPVLEEVDGGDVVMANDSESAVGYDQLGSLLGPMGAISGTVAGSPSGSFATTGVWTTGKATHYGPFPSIPYKSEIGYLPNDVGVGCSNGVPGGDPRLERHSFRRAQPPHCQHLRQHQHYLAESSHCRCISKNVRRDNKAKICFQKLKMRNKNRPEFQVDAYIVDFCPTNGCLWGDEELAKNADIYGEETWLRLGGSIEDATMSVEIQWPAGIDAKDTLSGVSASRYIASAPNTVLPILWLPALIIVAVMRLFA
ncbi:hypothetical protein BC829DRAFT_416771 [Chytridium lagenaria]|nr:hypothetical protein BC829DRAFT_416771 [Chytridium lagenaria]